MTVDRIDVTGDAPRYVTGLYDVWAFAPLAEGRLTVTLRCEYLALDARASLGCILQETDRMCQQYQDRAEIHSHVHLAVRIIVDMSAMRVPASAVPTQADITRLCRQWQLEGVLAWREAQPAGRELSIRWH